MYEARPTRQRLKAFLLQYITRSDCTVTAAKQDVATFFFNIDGEREED